MSAYIDRKYLLLLSSKLDRFKQKSQTVFNFRCPFCGDSKKSLVKARGFMYESQNEYFYSCKNCGISKNMDGFLAHVSVDQHKAYRVEKYVNKRKRQPQVVEVKPEVKYTFDLEKTDQLVPLTQLPDGHFAKKYIESRLIPKDTWNLLFYTANFKLFLDQAYPEHSKDMPEDRRIIMFYENFMGKITHVCGRALDESDLRYVTIRVDANAIRKTFGLSRIDFDKKIQLLEGQFDSLLLDNTIAAGDSSLYHVTLWLRKEAGEKELDIVEVYDNEPYNKEICKQIFVSVKAGHKVVLFPSSVKEKDINDMIKAGRTKDEVQKLIDAHTYQGLEAQLRFMKWRK